MDKFSYSKAFELAPFVWEKIDEHFHHGSCDGTMFIGPAEKTDFVKFWNKHNEDFKMCTDLERNKSILNAYSFSQYSIYCRYIDDNSWSEGIWKYDDSTKDWDLYIMISSGDL